jgi:hypothetical protein
MAACTSSVLPNVLKAAKQNAIRAQLPEKSETEIPPEVADERPDTWVTLRTGDIGYTSSP